MDTKKEQTGRLATLLLAVVATASVVLALLAIRTASSRSEEIEQLRENVALANDERDGLVGEVAIAKSDAAVTESRWLASVAISGNYSPTDSRLLAVEASNRSSTAEAEAALGFLLFADNRADPPIAELDHDGPVWVTAAATSSDVRATGSDDGTAKVWSAGGDLLATLPASGRVSAIDVAANDQLLVVGSDDGIATTWTIDGEQVQSAAHTDGVNDVGLSRDGNLMASAGSDNMVLVTDVVSGENVHRFEHSDAVWAVALPPVGADYLASASQDGLARVWDLQTGEELASYDLGKAVTTLEFSPDGKWLFAGGQGTTALLIATADWEARPALEGTFRGGVVDVDWHPQGGEIAVVSLGGINRYDLPGATLVAERRLTGGARGVAYSPDGRWFVTGSGDFQFNFGEVIFWDSATGSKLTGLNLGGPVESISVDSTGTVLAGFRSTEDFIEVGGAWLVPGPDDWVALACSETDGFVSEEVWSELSGQAGGLATDCP